MNNTEKATATRAMFTYAIPGYWIEYDNGEREFSPYGDELTEEQKRTVHSFPCNVFKAIKTAEGG